MELELSKRLAKHAEDLLHRVDRGEITGVRAAEELHKKLNALVEEFRKKGLDPGPDYKNYALVHAVDHALSKIYETRTYGTLVNLFGEPPSSTDNATIVRAVALIHRDEKLRKMLENALKKHGEILRFISYALYPDHRDIASYATALNILQRREAGEQVPEKDVRWAEGIKRYVNDITVPAEYIGEVMKLLENVREAMSDFVGARAVLRARELAIREYGKDRAERIFSDILAKLSEDGVSTMVGDILAVYNRAHSLENEALFKENGHLHAYAHYFLPHFSAYVALMSKLAEGKAREDVEGVKANFRRAFLEHKRVSERGDSERMKFLESVLHGHLAALGEDGWRIYEELAKIYNHDPFGLLRGKGVEAVGREGE